MRNCLVGVAFVAVMWLCGLAFVLWTFRLAFGWGTTAFP
jgi:hypothetical protein